MNIYGNFGGGYGVPPFTQNPFYGAVKPENSRNDGPMLFVALAPFFTVILEGLIGDIIAAAILWVFCYFLCVMLCRYDYKKYVKPIEFNNFNLAPTVFVPIVYLFKRQKVFPNSKAYWAVCLAILIVSIMQCGFVQLLSFDEKSCLNTITNSSCALIDEVSDDENVLSKNTIGEAIRNYADTDNIDWTSKRIDYGTYKINVVFEAYYNGELRNFYIEFTLNYNIYSFDGLSIDSISVDGSELSEADKKAVVMNIFTSNSAETDHKSESNIVEV